MFQQPISYDEIAENGWTVDVNNGDTTYDVYRWLPSGSTYVAETVSVWSDSDTCVGWTITRAHPVDYIDLAEIKTRSDARDFLDNQDRYETEGPARQMIDEMRENNPYTLVREVA